MDSQRFADATRACENILALLQRWTLRGDRSEAAHLLLRYTILDSGTLYAIAESRAEGDRRKRLHSSHGATSVCNTALAHSHLPSLT